MKERDLYPVIQRWLRINMIGKSGAVEVKLCKTKSLPYSEIYEHQWNSLEVARFEGKVLTYKIPDEGVSSKPFDIIFLSQSETFICIAFYEFRKKVRFYLIRDYDLFSHKINSNRKSITEGECKELSSYSFIIGGKQ